MPSSKYHDIQQTYFEWSVSDTDYQWVSTSGNKILKKDGEKSSEWSLLLCPRPGPKGFVDDSLSSTYRPLEDEPTLFQQFADIELNEEEILTFANKYGCLLKDIEVISEEPDMTIVNTRMDSYSDWIQETLEMKEALQLWYGILDASSEEDSAPAAIASLEGMFDVETLQLSTVFRYRAINETLRSAVAVGKSESIDISDIAKNIVVSFINRKLRQEGVTPQLVTEAGFDCVPYLVPENLIGAMWLQFYFWVAGEKDFKRCPICGFWEETTDLRSDWKEHKECGARRRARESYERKKQASASKTKKGR